MPFSTISFAALIFDCSFKNFKTFVVCACTLAFYTNWFFNSCSAPSRNAHALTQRCDRSVCHCSLHTETLLNDPRPHGSPVLLSSHQIELHHVTSDLCDLTHLKTLLEIRVLFSIFIDFCLPVHPIILHVAVTRCSCMLDFLLF